MKTVLKVSIIISVVSHEGIKKYSLSLKVLRKDRFHFNSESKLGSFRAITIKTKNIVSGLISSNQITFHSNIDSKESNVSKH